MVQKKTGDLCNSGVLCVQSNRMDHHVGPTKVCTGYTYIYIYMQFEANPVPLTARTETHKFNGFKSNKKFDHRSNDPVHQDRCIPMGSGAIRGGVGGASRVCGWFRSIISWPAGNKQTHCNILGPIWTLGLVLLGPRWYP